jgi:DNA-binding transcriptional ArsR family regulator
MLAAMSDERDPGTAAGTGTGRPVRRMDARSLRALAHPLRMSVMEMLTDGGPATATGLAARLGESTGTVSWHLRHLAEHGFIEEDEERGTRRERWWRVVRQTKVLDTGDFTDDPATRSALSVYLHEFVQTQFSRVTTYLADTWDEEWHRAGTLSDWTDLRLTPAQLIALNEELSAVIARHTPDPDAPPEPGSLPVSVQIQSFPRKEGRTA